ncbi:MAG: HEAT repeat domain-containing protein [Candidatus Marinimicrobia bacterium]|nr:HEAT repeat domain-containing protein [Candidatus Neomarinimicrobiota bacterium]
MVNDMAGGIIRSIAGAILLMAVTVPLIGLSQNADPEASARDALSRQIMPPRVYSINDKGEVIKIDFPTLPVLPQIYAPQDALESVPGYLQDLEENLRLQELEQFNVGALQHLQEALQFEALEQLQLDALDLDLDAFDLEMQVYDLEQGLLDDCDCGPVVVAPASMARSVMRAKKALVTGQDPDLSVLPVPKDPRSRVRGRNNRVVVAPAPSSARTKEAYQAAYSLILDEKWRDAGDALQAFIQNNYKNRYTDDATFWFAYSLEKIDGASEKVFDAYYAFVSLYPSSSWEDDAKANLIRLGMVLVKSDRKNRSKYEPVMAALRKDDDIKVAISALYGLRRIGDETSLKAIISIYDETANEELRKNVVSTLARFDGELVVDKLAEIAINDPNDEVRSTALQALGRSDQAKAAVVLRQLATTDDDPKVRLSAIKAIGRMRGSNETITITIKALESIAKTDVHVKVRTEAVLALGKIGTSEAQEALVRILSGN